MPDGSAPREYAGLMEVFQAFPGPARPLLEYHEAVLRGDSPFSPAEREMMAAYVSGINGCVYWLSHHQAIAEVLGGPKDLVGKLLKDIEVAPLDERFKPVFRFLRKLTMAPHEVSRDDAQAILDAGWSDEAIFSAVAVCALFNQMNRIVDGLGLKASSQQVAQAAAMIGNSGYGALLNFLGPAKPVPGTPINRGLR